MSPETAKKEKALDRANKWAGAGRKAHQLALATEKAALEGEIISPTKENIETTIRGAMKLFLDGNICSKEIVRKMQAAGLDMNNLRRSLVEKTISQAIPKIMNEGDIERLMQLAAMAGESTQPDIPDGAKRITRERVVIELED
ncbi:MAG: hypothetical protein J6S67_23305 [Methanobrevibacter sp.]|nr:hypothetical protein [Methanobrevibacter sp.]